MLAREVNASLGRAGLQGAVALDLQQVADELQVPLVVPDDQDQLPDDLKPLGRPRGAGA